ncbi:diacylglycerol/lipid kinase family protein [Planococcus salinus]|uniref:Diacylglycerol kinase family lipid kinase n=1 Tax=Planococcus salinus TaxID=1848460 RepID=A0A3M8P919_9BACL|nr:diacylglycerol kinase family protein [Planococcus salinus]RNF40112.1 diacylglycerol kinase family lipid kinase [Planococcus salinus]
MPRFDRSVLLYNGKAGASTSEDLFPLAVPVLARESKNLELIQTGSEEEFTEACLAAEPADALFVAGGDGTVHLAVQALSKIEDPPVLGILPSGTCNDFARTLQIPLLLDEAAEELTAGMVEEVDTAQINGKFFLNFAGIGLITDASTNIDPQVKGRYGRLSYFMSALQSMRQAASFSFSIDVDGTQFTDEAVLLLVMNGNSIGTHTFPLASIDPTDGLLDVFVIQTTSIAAVLEWFSLSQPDTVPEELEHVAHFQGKRISIHTEEEMDVDTDGEIHEKTPVEIAVQPQRLKMLVPSRRDPDF